jgi:hypothetical protein
MKRLLLIVLVLIAQAIPATAQSREKDLDKWLDREAIPHVRQQLLVHPRFKGETVMFVVMRDNLPAPQTNSLAISLRDRLLDAAVNTPGVVVGWQQGRAPAAGGGAVDCARGEVHYYIGVELGQELDSTYSVTVRALDVEDRSWVTGFGMRWQGSLGTIQRQAMRQSRVDTTFRGSRDVPFTLAETDLLAAHLAQELSCALGKGLTGEYVLSTEAAGNAAPDLEAMPVLVGNNLAGRGTAEIAPSPAQGNALLLGMLHRVDGPLHQYWLTVMPHAGAADLSTLSASAYVLLPGHALARAEEPASTATQGEMARAPAVAARAAVSIPNAGAEALLAPLRIGAADAARDCSSLHTRSAATFTARPRCSLLQTVAQSDVIVFFLAHQANHGLVRLGDAACRERTLASIGGSGNALRFPIPRTESAGTVAETLTWFVEPQVDTYYAVAVTDAHAARNFANHIDRLPLRCSDAVREGLSGEELRAWLDRFATLAAESAQHFDWRALQIRNVL